MRLEEQIGKTGGMLLCSRNNIRVGVIPPGIWRPSENAILFLICIVFGDEFGAFVIEEFAA